MNNIKQRVVLQLLNEFELEEKIGHEWFEKRICKDNYLLAKMILKDKTSSCFALCYDLEFYPKFYKIFATIKKNNRYFVKFCTTHEL